ADFAFEQLLSATVGHAPDAAPTSSASSWLRPPRRSRRCRGGVTRKPRSSSVDDPARAGDHRHHLMHGSAESSGPLAKGPSVTIRGTFAGDFEPAGQSMMDGVG